MNKKVLVTSDVFEKTQDGIIGDIIEERESDYLVRIDGLRGHSGNGEDECSKHECWYFPKNECEIIEEEAEEPRKTLDEVFYDQFPKETNKATPLVFEPKKLLVVYVDKEMTSAQCIKHAKVIEEHLGFEYRVLVVDRKVSNVQIL